MAKASQISQTRIGSFIDLTATEEIRKWYEGFSMEMAQKKWKVSVEATQKLNNKYICAGVVSFKTYREDNSENNDKV